MIRILILFAFVVGVSGCSRPLREINYRGAIPAAEQNAFETAQKFAAILAQETDLKVTDRTTPTGSAGVNSSAGVDLRTDRSHTVWVSVIVYAEQHLIVARVAGDIDAPIANDMAAACERVYLKQYPSGEFVRFQRERGFFGP